SDYDTKRFTFMGEGIEGITGYPAEEVTLEKWNSMVQDLIMRGEAARLPVAEARRRAAEGSLRLWQADVQIRTRAGETRWVASTAVQLFDVAGRVTGSLGILQDVTERVLFTDMGAELAAADTLDKVARTV